MEPGTGCTVETVWLDAGLLGRLRLGSESADWWLDRAPDRECHDCAVIDGQFHHVGCDMEQCPNCQGQLLSCGCLAG